MANGSDLEHAAETAFSALQPSAQRYFREMGLVPHFITRPYEERKTTTATRQAIEREIESCIEKGPNGQYDPAAHKTALDYFGMMLARHSL